MMNDYAIEYKEHKLYCDNKGAIDLSKNSVSHSKAKHIEIRNHFIRDLVDNKSLTLEHVSTRVQVVDAFTKPLDRERFESLRTSLGMCIV